MEIKRKVSLQDAAIPQDALRGRMGLRRSKIYRIVLPRRPEEGLKGQNWSPVAKKGCPAGKVDWNKI